MFDVQKFESLTSVCRGKSVSYSEIGSTNTEAKNAILSGAAESGHIFIAESQTNGRGRGNHQWSCPTGEGLLFTLVLDPDVDIHYWYRMSLAVGMAIVEVTSAIGIETQMKWPNDIYCGDKKLGGILIEAVEDKLVVGVGLNVNVQSFPSDLSEKATSLYQQRGVPTDREELLSKVITAIYQNGSLIGRGFPSLLERIQECLYMKGSLVSMKTSEGKLVGRLQGLSDNGYLLIQEMSESANVRELMYASDIRKVES